MGMIFKAIGLFVLLVSLSMCAGMCTHPTPKPTPESKLEETCKDWIYNRNRALKLGKEGDQKGAEEARRAMLGFMKDLERDYSEQQISETIERIEKSGYRAGF